jgi:amino acid adenylation domain-containing protein
MNSMSVSEEKELSAFSQDKADLLRLLLERETTQAQKISPYPRGSGTDVVRLRTSRGQQRLWFIDQLEARAAGYNSSMGLRLRGGLDQEALQKALDTLVQRHEVLRTVFVSVEGDPRQEIAPEGCFSLKVIDLSHYEEVEREVQVRLHESEEARGKFDLRVGPLIRGRLLRVQAEEHVLLITTHHIVSDGWSWGVLFGELAELYRAYWEGRGDPLEPLPIQYADYAQWQREWLQGEELDKQLSYWRAHLEGAAPQLELPTDRPRPAVQSYRGENVGVVLDAQLTAKLRAFAQRHELTLFMILHGVLSILLSRLSGQEDVVIGTPIAGRRRPELEGLIGFFVNTLVLRVGVRGDLRMEEFLKQVKEVTLGAYDHQDVPFEQLVEALQPQRSLSRNPLFQVSFALQNAPKSDLRLPALTVSPEGGGDNPAIFDLFLSLEERGDEIVGSVNYAADLLDRETVERWMTCFTVLLRGMTDGVQSRIGDLPMMPESERYQVIELFNATQVAYPQEKLIHELFEEQVERTPEAVAVVYEGQSLTYAELNGRANQLARYLRENGVGPDQLVGICVERSLETVVGLLGILKAGGAYVPLDPNYPTERLTYVLNDAAPRVLLTQERLRERLPNTAAAVIALDNEWNEIAKKSTSSLDLRESGLGSHHLAYVIYTSGSTGKPKGVMVQHAGVVNFLISMQQNPGVGATDRVLAVTTVSFDIAGLEIYLPLISGAQLVVASREAASDARLLMSMIEEYDVTVLQATPATWQLLLSAGWDGRSNLKALCGGEALSTALSGKLINRVGSLWNLYGPTETTIWSCGRQIVVPDERGSVESIGRPIANTEMYILDPYRHPVPVGVAGEIYIGGAGVARGYLNRPELTAERFLSDPFSAESQARMYRTGDLGRWRSDGSIEYLGRNDHQVKIRGFRIELGEIEAQLLQHAQVKEAVVIAREDEPGDKRLMAYVVGDRSAAPEAASDGVPEKLRNEIVGEWETIWKETYGTQAQITGPSFVSWNSSYTGEPIPEPQMQEWLTGTVERIQALRPKKVLEIGCGVGLVVQHLAPKCEVYVGTDISTSGLAQLRQWMSGREDLKHVELLHRSATELQDLQSGSFDTVVVNSVVQYFPDIEYLLAILREAVRLLGPGGKIFIGDVRHLGLLTMFHSAVQLTKASATLSVGQLRKRIVRAVSQEKELVIDPQFFQVLPGRVPGISAVEVQLKRGRATNELMCYRYDVVLHTGEQMGTRAECERLDWPAVGSAAEFEAAVRERRWSAARVSSIPNGRLAREAAAQRLIETSDERLEAGVLRRQLNELQGEQVDPEQFWRWGEEHGYDVQVSWSTPDSLDSVELQLLDRARADQIPRVALQPPKTVRPWSAYANDPLEHSFRQQLIPQLREYLKGRLPEYMIPSGWMALKQLPLTPNGKLDRGALPAPQSRPEEMGEYIAPRTELERTLASIWAQVLRVDQVGVQDNFFELGGHSLLIVQMMERLRQVGLSAELRSIYASPTLADLAAKLAGAVAQQFVVPPNLIPAQCEAITPQMLPLVELTVEQIERIVQTVPGGAANIQDIYPLTPLQEGILFHHLLNDQGDAYARPMLLSVSSREKLEKLIAALQAVIDRHDILRTAMLWEQLSQPVQVVYRRASLRVEELELAGDRDPLEQLKERMQLERQRLDLRQAPLLRVEVAPDRRGSQWYALLQTHHLVFDNQSLQSMLAEVMAYVEGRAQGLPEAGAYRNYVAQTLAEARKGDAESFFRSKLGEIDEPTAPFGLLDVHGDGSRIEEAHHAFEPELAKRVRTQARRLSVSAATLFHAAWALVVSRTSGRDDVVFGTVLLGRLQGTAGAQRTLGMFINTLPLRLRLEGMTAAELVEQTQRELVELLNYEQASLAVAQRCSGITGSGSLFSTLLNYLHSTSSETEQSTMAPGIEMLASQGRTNYPIALSVYDQGEGFVLKMETDQRIDPNRMLGYISTAIQSLVEALEQAPQRAALRLPILPESERHQVIESFNATQAAYPQEKLIHELFEEQVKRTPAAVAVVYEGQSLTYAELNGRANQLARYLRDKGVGPDQLVGICVERGLEMVVGVLGVLKAGGAYVPLDPKYPPERLAYMLNDAAPTVLLTQERLRERVPETVAEMIALDDDWNEIAGKSTSNLNLRASGAHSHHLAYVIYTSGSTGTPKGVMVEHAGLLNYLQWALDEYALETGESVIVSSPLAFDATVTSLYCPLLSGRSVVLVADGQELEGLEQLLQQPTQWSLIKISPAHLQVLGQRLQSAKLPCTVDAFVIGGEALPPSTVQLWRSIWPQVRLINEYGPTETVVGCCVYDIPPEWVAESSVPIGCPIANTQIYMLDPHRQPVPIGVVGEIYIGGAGVARGYLNRPELTAERFLSDPFSADRQARMYKTGDLGRWRPDGTIEYLGRNDHQVKIRGFRIELGEIEAQLVRHAQVKEAVVLAREDVPGEKRLVAYVIPQDPSDVEKTPSVEALREYLKSVLPEHMVPSAFVMLEQLPLTSNGKLDRRALPAPELGAYVSRQYEAPQGEVEEILAGIWQGLLRVERVGRQDNFFELGGHSLLIVQVMEQLRRVGLSAEIRHVFESPSLAELARALTRKAVGEFEVPPNLIPAGCEAITPQMLPLVELEAEHIERIVQSVPGGAANVQDIYPLAPLQEGILFHHLLDEQGGDTYVLPTALSVSSRERLEELITALQGVIDRHDVLRTAVLWEQLPQPVQVVYRQVRLPVQEIALDRDRDPMELVKEWVTPERQRLDLRQAPLMRLQVAADPHGEQWYVLLQIHHLTCDHVTFEAVMSEVVAHLENRAQRLSESVPYRNHVAQALASARAHDAESFFRSKLGEIDEPTAPFGLLNVHGDGSQIEEAQEEFELALAQRVRAQARRLSVSAATLFHAAWGLVVGRTSGRDDVVFGSVLLGRLQGSAGAQQILGMFINTLPLRLRLQGVTAKELVEQTQRELVELLSHEQASLAVAQRCSGIVGSAPLFSVLLNYRHSVPNPEGDLRSASGIRVLAGQERTNYPITLSVDDLGEGFALTAQTDRRIDPQRMTGYLHTAVQSLVEALERAPQTAALALSILPQSERHQVIELFNATQVAYPQDKLIHELFEEQVKRTPAAVAVVYEGQSLTYAELNGRANQLARYLRDKGVGPDQLVGICVERSLEMVVGLLGILKAGGAYVPLDPNYPTERLQYMLEDAAPRVVLTQEKLRTMLPATQAEVIELEDKCEATSGYIEENPAATEVRLTAQNLVYVIYTSGSTGRPKGTAMTHRSMVNLIEWHRRNLCSREGQRVLQFAALSFDVAFQDTFSTLCTGSTLVLTDEWVRRDPQALAEFLSSLFITRLFIPPLVLQSLAECFNTTSALPPMTLQDIITAGEQLRISPEISRFFKHLNGCRLHNHYGPTETHVVTALTLTGDPDAWPALPTIGTPISNTQIYILDGKRQAVPTSVKGEIYIGGTGVARGYLGRPELTAQRFIDDPFSADPQARMYKTGDLGRWQPDGTIEYLGRNDDQVKIRGYRIELGEIEAQLARHKQVKDAAVVAREDIPGERRLVAYVIQRDQSGPSSEELRAYLKAVLPEYMVPNAFVILESLPLTPNGKLDRRALPTPEMGAYVSQLYEAPCGEVEEILAGIWREMLQLERVGRQDNFFELGGHSLHAMKLITRVAQQFTVRLSAIAVFQHPTIREMASVVERLRLGEEKPPSSEGPEFEEGVI